VYNSNRIMLYYIARILDLSKPDSDTVITRTVELVQQNNRALRDMSLMYPLAEPLCITTERWLETVRTSLARGHANTYIAPQDPAEVRNEVQQAIDAPATDSSDLSPAQERREVALLPSIDTMIKAVSPPNQPLSTTDYSYPVLSSEQMTSSLATLADVATQPSRNNGQLSTDTSAGDFDQPVFNLDDLQNFFEWETNSGDYAQLTGFDGFGPLGWANNFSSM
jgi:hypothetical protein